MVQYGGGLPSGGRNHPLRTIRSPRLNLRNALLLLVALFVLRNLLLNDYREEEIQHLRNSGMTEEQIKRYVPSKAMEQGRNDDLKRMKEDIAYLLKEVEVLKAGQRSPEKRTQHNNDSGRGEPSISVDRIHEEKRRIKEEMLVKEHPDFKPSKRLKDSLADIQREPKVE